MSTQVREMPDAYQLRRRKHKLGRLAAMERAGIKIVFKDRG